MREETIPTGSLKFRGTVLLMVLSGCTLGRYMPGQQGRTHLTHAVRGGCDAYQRAVTYEQSWGTTYAVSHSNAGQCIGTVRPDIQGGQAYVDDSNFGFAARGLATPLVSMARYPGRPFALGYGFAADLDVVLDLPGDTVGVAIGGMYDVLHTSYADGLAFDFTLMGGSAQLMVALDSRIVWHVDGGFGYGIYSVENVNGTANFWGGYLGTGLYFSIVRSTSLDFSAGPSIRAFLTSPTTFDGKNINFEAGVFGLNFFLSFV